MSFIKSISRSIYQSMEKRAAVRIYDHLQYVDATTLSQAGISRELLSQGPSAYPWRLENTKTSAEVVSISRMNEPAIRQGITELKACSDAELHDLGISRGEIAHVVRYGRHGMEDFVQDQDRRVA